MSALLIKWPKKQVRYIKINRSNEKYQYFNVVTDEEGKFSLLFPDGEYVIEGFYDEDWNYTELNRTIVVENGTTNPNPIIIEVTESN